jgi:uncharacterized membrane protein YhaH (DUF805 family)
LGKIGHCREHLAADAPFVTLRAGPLFTGGGLNDVRRRFLNGKKARIGRQPENDMALNHEHAALLARMGKGLGRWLATRLGPGLGYAGRSDRRAFVAGAALTVIGPYALSLVIRGSVARLFAVFPRTVALALALILTLLVCAAIVGWFWGWSVLLTRRARDIGLPAWSGLTSLFVLIAILTTVKGSTAPDLFGWISVTAWAVFAAVWSVWPSRDGAWPPGGSEISTKPA